MFASRVRPGRVFCVPIRHRPSFAADLRVLICREPCRTNRAHESRGEPVAGRTGVPQVSGFEPRVYYVQSYGQLSRARRSHAGGVEPGRAPVDWTAPLPAERGRGRHCWTSQQWHPSAGGEDRTVPRLAGVEGLHAAVCAGVGGGDGQAAGARGARLPLIGIVVALAPSRYGNQVLRCQSFPRRGTASWARWSRA